jgi:hypothetical protein
VSSYPLRTFRHESTLILPELEALPRVKISAKEHGAVHAFEGALLGDASPEQRDKAPLEGEDEGTNNISRRVDIGCGQAALSFSPREFLSATAPESSHPNTRLSGKILVDCQRNFASTV